MQQQAAFVPLVLNIFYCLPPLKLSVKIKILIAWQKKAYINQKWTKGD